MPYKTTNNNTNIYLYFNNIQTKNSMDNLFPIFPPVNTPLINKCDTYEYQLI